VEKFRVVIPVKGCLNRSFFAFFRILEICFGIKDEYKQEQEQAFRASSIIEWLIAFLMVRKISLSDCYVA